MSVEIVMPKLSDTMEEGTILKWLKQVGDRVAAGEVIAEVETDKADMELEAYDEGVLSEVRVAEGQSAPVGAVIAVLTAPGEQAATKKPAAPATTTSDGGGAKQAQKATPKPAQEKASAAAAEPGEEPEMVAAAEAEA